MMRVLLVEDDVQLAQEMSALLRSENFAVDVVDNGVDALHLGDTENYDAAVLDLGLPLLDGITVLQGWRKEHRDFPVLILTARDTWSDKVAGFKAGADDYLAKPFMPPEVVLRLRALVRRSSGHAANRIVCGRLEHDTQTGAFDLDGKALHLTAFEWRILSTLMLRKEVTVDRPALIDHVYEHAADNDSNSIEVVIGRLRRKIGAEMIVTVRGRGYRLTAKGAR